MPPFRCLSPTLRRTAAMILLACMALALWSAVQPGLSLPGAFGGDKGLHLFVFALLAALSRLASDSPRMMKVWIALLLALGGGIEIAQGIVPERDPSLADLVADLVGIGTGLLLGRWLIAFLRRLPWRALAE